MEKENNLTSLEIKQIDLSLSDEVKEYINFCENIRKLCEITCGVPKERIEQNITHFESNHVEKLFRFAK